VIKYVKKPLSMGFKKLCKEGMRLESTAKGAYEISGDMKINKIGKYSRKNQKKKRDDWQSNKNETEKKKNLLLLLWVSWC